MTLAACAGAPLAEPSAAAGPDWRRIATPGDRARLRGWRTAFVSGLEQARAGGHAAEVEREGVLLTPDAGRSEPPPPGEYRCRVVKLGAQGRGGLAYVAYPAFACRIDGEGRALRFTKLTGSQRPVGMIYQGERRLVFLGTLVLGEERRALDYGRDPDRDMIGAVESLGDGRWRVLLPYPRHESLMDVVELVPDQRP